jgi:predicted porin
MGASSITTKNVDSDGVAAASVTARDLTGAERARTGGRLTFTGVEDLGGGMKAGFDYTANLYSGITEPTKVRRANISLSGGFGTVAIGSFDSNALDAVRGFSATTAGGAGGDFQARTATGAALLGYATAVGVTGLTAADLSTGLSGSSSNAIVYALPAMGNLTANVAVVNQSRVADTATPVTAAQKVNAYLLGAAYVDGPLTVKFGYGNAKRDQVVAAAPAAAGDFGKIADTAIGASYNLGSVVPYATYETAKAKDQDGAFLKTTGYELGAKFPMGALTPYVSVASGKFSDEAGKFASTSAYQIGTTYDLSKRTYFYANYGQDKVKGTQAGDSSSAKRTGYNAGLVHQF